MPTSSSKYLKGSDLKGMSAAKLRLARNEIYARHGRKFDDKSLQDYFNGKSWYTPRINAKDFTASMLNRYERKNLEIIVAYEKKMGYR